MSTLKAEKVGFEEFYRMLSFFVFWGGGWQREVLILLYYCPQMRFLLLLSFILSSMEMQTSDQEALKKLANEGAQTSMKV